MRQRFYNVHVFVQNSGNDDIFAAYRIIDMHHSTRYSSSIRNFSSTDRIDADVKYQVNECRS